MIKNLNDKDLYYKIYDLIRITRDFKETEQKTKKPNDLILCYLSDIELILFTLYCEQIQELTNDIMKDLEKHGLKIENNKIQRIK